jgi:hypothetical protein
MNFAQIYSFISFKGIHQLKCHDVVNLWYKTRTIKLPSMKRKSNKKFKRNKRKFTSSFTIAIPIINFTNVVKEIQFLKMEMKKLITSQML